MAGYLADLACFPAAESDAFLEELEPTVRAVVRLELPFVGAFVQDAVIRETIGSLLGRIHCGCPIRPMHREDLARLVREAYRRLSRPIDHNEDEGDSQDGPLLGPLSRMMRQFLLPVHSSHALPCPV